LKSKQKSKEIKRYIYIFFFGMFTQEGKKKIRTNDFRFIKRGLNRLNQLF
jgi:hypothetical protein